MFGLSRWRNANRPRLGLGSDGPVMPARVITKPPTAELRENQRDDDSLPPYAVLDPILQAYLEKGETVAAIANSLQVDIALVRDIVRRICQNEHKRVQASLSIRVSRKAFGLGRRVPVIQGFRE